MDKTQFMPPTSFTLTLLSTMLRLQKMFNFSFVRMAVAYKVHLYPNELSSKVVENIFELVKTILENVKIVIFVVNKSIKYLLFRVYHTGKLMIKAATAMAAARMERSESGQQFLILCPVENSWGKG